MSNKKWWCGESVEFALVVGESAILNSYVGVGSRPREKGKRDERRASVEKSY